MGTYQKIFHYQRSLLIFFYALFCMAMVYPIILLLQLAGVVNVALMILVPLVFIVLCAFAGSYLFVLSYIPLKLVDAFDVIRNKIASGEINTVEQFALNVNRFTVKFFSFKFFDIVHSAMIIGNDRKVFVSEKFPIAEIGSIDDLWEVATHQEDVYHVGFCSVHDDKLYKVMVPVWFGREHLGMMILWLQAKPGKFFTGMIRDYEELFIDDQLLHVVNLGRRTH